MPAFASFAAEHGLGFTDTVERLAAKLRQAAVPVTDGDPVIAIVSGPGDYEHYGHLHTALREALIALWP